MGRQDPDVHRTAPQRWAPVTGPGYRAATSEEFTMMYWGNGLSGWGYVLMALNMVVFWGLLIGGIVLLVRSLGGNRPQSAPSVGGSDPQRVLADRYARGDIDEDEYRQRLKVLGGV